MPQDVSHKGAAHVPWSESLPRSLLSLPRSSESQRRFAVIELTVRIVSGEHVENEGQPGRASSASHASPYSCADSVFESLPSEPSESPSAPNALSMASVSHVARHGGSAAVRSPRIPQSGSQETTVSDDGRLEALRQCIGHSTLSPRTIAVRGTVNCPTAREGPQA
jgi:hypothetical protein